MKGDIFSLVFSSIREGSSSSDRHVTFEVTGYGTGGTFQGAGKVLKEASQPREHRLLGTD